MSSLPTLQQLRTTHYPKLVTTFHQPEHTTQLMLSVSEDQMNQLLVFLIANGIPFSQQSVEKPNNDHKETISTELITNTMKTFNLSSREQEVILEVIHGLGYQDIAKKLFISLETVRSHIKNSYRKMDVSSRAEAIAKILKLN